METEVLYSSEDLLTAIKRTLRPESRDDRRVALVAYVGAGAEAYLPSPKGLEVVCALEPGATSELALLSLRERGALISCSDGLHMKVYWSSRNGCVIGSANASKNALGRKSNKEAGVWLPPGAVDIDKLLTYCAPRPIEDADLRKLAADTDIWRSGKRTRATPTSVTFSEWMEQGGARKPWKIGWWDGFVEPSKQLVKAGQQEYGVNQPHEFLRLDKGTGSRYDWFLMFRLPECRSVRWLYSDLWVMTKRVNFPIEVGQAKDASYYQPPFVIDSRFRKALRTATEDADIASVLSLTPPKKWLAQIEANLGNLD